MGRKKSEWAKQFTVMSREEILKELGSYKREKLYSLILEYNKLLFEVMNARDAEHAGRIWAENKVKRMAEAVKTAKSILWEEFE